MKREFSIKRFFQLNNWPVYVMSLAAVLFISLLFPSAVTFDYEYSKGNSWKYDDLIAPFDFPILKDPTIYNAQVDEVKAGALEVYLLNTGVQHTHQSKLKDQLISELNAISGAGLDTMAVNQLIKEIYEVGVVNRSEDRKVRVIHGNNSITTNLNQYYDKEKVLDKIASALLKDSIRLNQATQLAIKRAIFPSIQYDESLTNKFLNDAINKIPRANGIVNEGEIIINKGQVISDNDLSMIESYKVSYQDQVVDKQSKRMIFFGYLILTLLIIFALLFYLFLNYPEIFFSWRKMLFILIWPALFSYLVYAIEQPGNLSAYIIPFCIVPLIVQNFYDERLAFFLHVVIILIASFLSILGYEFAFIEILAGIVIIQASTDTRYWNTFFGLILILFITYMLSYLGLELIKVGNFSDINIKVFIWLGINTLLTLLAYPLIPLLEKVFGFTSSITMVELADFNSPLLKRLSLEAPGTFQHSMQVANLSEAAADKIGANSLLVKVAALYHDIGKMVKPEAFIENQDSYINPHDAMTNFESARVIISHVTEGEKMAKKAGLPEVLIDFIRTHHGTTRVEYFYRNQLKNEPDREFDESLFRYPGPKPTTKEQTILMLADSIEAASKSLKSPTGKDIDELVDNIVKYKGDQHQLSDSELSFGELRTVIDTFKSLLRNIYHVRIEYPDDPSDVTKETNPTQA